LRYEFERQCAYLVIMSTPTSRSRPSRIDLVAAYLYLPAAAACGFSVYASARLIGWWGCAPWLALGAFYIGKFYVEIRRYRQAGDSVSNESRSAA